MKFTTVTALTAILSAVEAKESRTFAVLRFTNKALVQARLDPIVNYGSISKHAHNIMGGSAFSATVTGQDLLKSQCTNAQIPEDKSNYWFPMLYFHDPKTGKFESVEVFYTNVYYFFEATNDPIKAFPVGLKMLVGDVDTRSPPAFGAGTNLDPKRGPLQPIKFTCPRSNMDTPAWPVGSNGTMAGMQDPGNKGEGVGFPDINCDGYASPLRMDIQFPSCYNPAVGLDDYKNNMVYPTDAGNGKNDCPPGHIHVPHIFFEVYFNTPAFKDRWVQGTGHQPFVLSNGDCTGYSAHADFISGWDVPTLQHIIDTCDAGSRGMDNCPGLPTGVNKVDCTIPSPLKEQVAGVLDALPGDNSLSGWDCGAPVVNPPKPSTTSTRAAPSQASTSTKPAWSSSSSSATASSGKPATTSSSSSGYVLPPASSPISSSVKPSAQPSESKTGGAKPTTSATVPDGACTPKTQTAIATVTVTSGSAVPSSTPTGTPGDNTPTIGGYKLVGCFKDGPDRALRGEILPNLGPMTNAKCIGRCKTRGFNLAGTEYGGQCYCGNELVASAKLDAATCNMKCEGDRTDVCGGSWALTVYSANGEAPITAAKVRRVEHVHKHRRRF